MHYKKTLYYGANVYYKNEFRQMDLVVDESSSLFFVNAGISHSDFDRVVDCNNYLIFPGLADIHVHLREPGFSCKETIKSGTLAAARGGYTAVCAMPNVAPPPDSMGNLGEMLDIIERDAAIHVLPYGAITKGQKGEGALSDMAGMAAHVAGFSDDGKGVQRAELMEQAMMRAKSLGLPIVAHCEDESLLLKGGCIHDGEYAKKHGYTGISSESEWKQVERDIELVRKTRCQYHVCHISTKESVALIRQAKKDGMPVTCETAPHYLVFTDNDLINDGRFKMNPPLRSPADRDALIDGIIDGTIDVIATDHAPHTADEKSAGLGGSLFGIVGLETALPIMYTYFVKTGIITPERLAELMAVRPREIIELNNPYENGKPANFTVFNPQKKYTISPADFLSKGKSTPFEGMEVFGETVLTVYNGKEVFSVNS